MNRAGSGSKTIERRRILAVDDIADNLLLLQFVLEAEGYEVELADSGRAALKSIETSPPDLVLLDVMMPDISGYEVLQWLRRHPRLSAIPVLLVTAYRDTTAQTIGVEADAFVPKPVEFVDLLAKVKALLQPQFRQSTFRDSSCREARNSFSRKV